MKLHTDRDEFCQASNRAFSMVEVLVAMSLVGIMFLSLYSGISSGFAVVQLARENLRATQILQEKMETIRLYNWDQVNQTGFIPTNFTASYYTTNQAGTGLIYTGSVSVASASMSESYNSDLRMVTVQLKWKSANVGRTREMKTLVSRYGLQNYIYY
jgi:prepilin-type N-terminal cleavage/methylation domain-containing protein